MFEYDSRTRQDEYLSVLQKLFKGTGVGGKDGKNFPGMNDSKYVTPYDGGKLVGFAIWSLIMAGIIVGLRMYARLAFGGGRLAIEDWMAIPAIVSTVFFTVVGVSAVTQSHLGRHAWDTSIVDLKSGLRFFYAQELLYVFAILFTKLSIIFYIRGLASGTLRRVCDGFFLFHVLFAFANLLAVAFQCTPIRAGYDLWAKLDTTCSTMKLYAALTSINVISDIAILLLPVQIVWALSLPLKKMMGVAFLLSLGFLACLGGVLRMAYLINGTRGSDFSWYFVNVALFGQLEVTFGIIAISLIPIKLIWHNFSPRILSQWASWRRSSVGCGFGKSSKHESSIMSDEAVDRVGKDPEMGQYYNLASPASTTNKRSLDRGVSVATTGGFAPVIDPTGNNNNENGGEGSSASPQTPQIPVHRHIAELQIRSAEDKVIRPREEKMRNMDFGVKTNLPPEAVKVAAMAAGRVSASTAQTQTTESTEEEPMSPIIRRPSAATRPMSLAATSVRTSFDEEDFSFPIQSNRSEEFVAGRNVSLSPMPPLPPIPPQHKKEGAAPRLHLKLY